MAKSFSNNHSFVSVSGPRGSVANKVRCAHSFFSRAKGLLGERNLDNQKGLWLRPCSSVHTLGMRFPIDLVFLGKDNAVAQLIQDVPPGRWFVAAAGSQSVLELAAGSVARAQVRRGDVLVMQPVNEPTINR